MARRSKDDLEYDSLKKTDHSTLADRLVDWPLLRLLVLHRGFRWVVILFLLAIITMALMLPKMWVATPDGFRPEVKISLLDRFQSWSLKRKAAAATERGEHGAAVQAWRAAWANDPGSEEALRGMLQSIARMDRPQEEVNNTLRGASWLLRLDQTNQTDIPIVGWACIRTGLSERALAIFQLAGTPLPESLTMLNAIAEFESGRIAAFRELLKSPEWESRIMSALDSEGTDPSDYVKREFRLVSLAFIAGWHNDPSKRTAALKQLEAAQQDLLTETVAYDLEFLIHLSQRNVQGCKNLLAKLEEIGKDTVRHHTSLWQLLLREGRRDEAVNLALRANKVPQSAWDAYQLGRTFTMLGRLDKANDHLRSYSRNVGWLAESLLLRADVLMRQAGMIPDPNVEEEEAPSLSTNRTPMEELGTLATSIRTQPDAMDALGGFSHYLEGMIDWYRGNQGSAENAFEKAAGIGFPDPNLGLNVAKSLLALGGAAKWAETILLGLPEDYRESPDYLEQLVKCSSQLLEDRYLLPTTQKLHELRPDDPTALNNYAAALLIARERPGEAVSLTFRLLNYISQRAGKNPVAAQNSKAWAMLQMNHSVALCMNNRGEDAVLALANVDPIRLDPRELVQYHLARFEANWLVGRLDHAKDSLGKLDRALLYPLQVAWLAKVEPQFEADVLAAEGR
jgi:tetratricopeptide (TPR) repeat protein